MNQQDRQNCNTCLKTDTKTKVHPFSQKGNLVDEKVSRSQLIPIPKPSLNKNKRKT